LLHRFLAACMPAVASESITTMQLEKEAHFEEVYRKLARLQIEPRGVAALTFSADAQVLEDNSKGLTRKSQALAAAASPATHSAEFEQEFQSEPVRLFVGVHPIRTKSNSFLLILLGFGVNDRAYEIAAAFRLYPSSPDERERLINDPCLALTTLIVKYGAEYDVERGERSLFEPLVDFDRGRFVMPDRVELADVTEALGFDSNPEAITLLTLMRVRVGGGVRLCFPMVFRGDAYLVDVEAARR
jgi:hypothetical protein